MFLEDVGDEGVDVGANVQDLVVKALEGQALALELHNSLLLIQTGFDPLFAHHLGYDYFCLVWVNFQESAQLLERYVLVNLRYHLDVVLYQCLPQHCVPFLRDGLLMDLQLFLKSLNVGSLNDSAQKHLLNDIIELQLLTSDVLVDNRDDSGFLGACWSQNCTGNGHAQQLLQVTGIHTFLI